MQIRTVLLSSLLLTAGVLLTTAQEQNSPDYPVFAGSVHITETLKVENSGEVHNLFDELGISGEIGLSEYTRFAGRIEISDLRGYNAGWTDGPAGYLFMDDGFNRTEVSLESDVLEQAGLDPAASVNLLIGYGSAQELLQMEFTEYRFERSSTSGIDGFNLAAAVRFGGRYSLTGAFNPASFNEEDKTDESAAGAGSPRPDVFGAFFMENDHRGTSWGPLIHFTSSGMQLFYDSSASLENNRLYGESLAGDAMTLGIGGWLEMSFAGMGIYGFGMTEYFRKYDRDGNDIVQAEWGAGFDIPVLSGIDANLSGSNAMVLSDGGEGSFMNFGLDVRAMLTDMFGAFGAAAAIGIMDTPGASLEGGVCLDFDYFEIYTGYSDHCIGADAKYAKGAFDKTEVKDGEALDGGFFLTVKASF